MTELETNIKDLRSQGKTYNEIKAILGCSKGTISYYLNPEGRSRQASRQVDRRRETKRIIQRVKQETPCTDCGENYPYWMMQFDHTSGDKSFTISEWAQNCGSRDKILAEIAKCEVVCANCHANRTHSRMVSTGEWTFDISEYYATK
jgi:hypothetical protein